MKFLKAFIPVLCIMIFESLTDYRDYLVHRNVFMMIFSREGYLLIIILFYIIYSKKSILRNVALILLFILLLLPYLLIGGIVIELYGIYIPYDLDVIFILVFLISIVFLELKQKSIYSILLLIIGIGIYFYQIKFYQYPLRNDVYEEFAYALRHSQFTSLRYALTYMLLLLSPIYLGFLSLIWKKSR